MFDSVFDHGVGITRATRAMWACNLQEGKGLFFFKIMPAKLLTLSYDEVRALSIRVKAKPVDEHTPGALRQQLIDHVCDCMHCLVAVMRQRAPLVYAGCPEFLELLERGMQMDKPRSPLAIVHITEELIEDYCFNRFTFIEIKALEAHLSLCRECASRVEHRRQFISLVKAALAQSSTNKTQIVTGVFGFNEDTGRTSEVAISASAV